jgi:4-amino-4-deoxy-L-arabinose transferase-like glycosyltransferase
MTESITFSLYCLAALLLMRALQSQRMLACLFAGAMLGLLCLTRMSFVILLPVTPGIVAVHSVWLQQRSKRHAMRLAAIFVLGSALVLGPWLARNVVSVGKWGLTEEYGSAALIERFAFDDMHAGEFVLAFPYCVPVIGAPAVDWAFGSQSMQRFDWREPNSFFRAGRARRVQLYTEHGRLDAFVGKIASEEMHQRGWRYLLSTIPLAWCGMWAGGIFALALVPGFALTCFMARGEERILLLLYSIPALAMLVLHAAVANHYTRYNLVLIAPFSVAAAWMLVQLAQLVRLRSHSAIPIAEKPRR